MAQLYIFFGLLLGLLVQFPVGSTFPPSASCPTTTAVHCGCCDTAVCPCMADDEDREAPAPAIPASKELKQFVLKPSVSQDLPSRPPPAPPPVLSQYYSFAVDLFASESRTVVFCSFVI